MIRAQKIKQPQKDGKIMNKGHEHFIGTLKMKGVSDGLINSLSEEDCDSLMSAMLYYETGIINSNTTVSMRDIKTIKNCVLLSTITTVAGICLGFLGGLIAVLIALLRF